MDQKPCNDVEATAPPAQSPAVVVTSNGPSPDSASPTDPTSPRSVPAGIGLPVRVGSYLLTRLIATGGMGSVYEAVQDQPRRIVALKLLRMGRQSAAQQRRFEFESQLLARLRHPGIAQVFEAGTCEHGDAVVPYFAMEFIPGALSITRYADQKNLSPADRLTLFAHVCDAVQHAHEKGIIHRDLKPGNILIDAQGQVKLIDFGIARASDSDQFSLTMQTGASQLIGTLQYMSPEQCESDPRQLDAGSDVYSLGVVLFELMCGQLPYDLSRAHVSEATRIIREDPPTKPSSINRLFRGDMETVLLKALHKDPAQRYRTASALAADIRHMVSGETILARRDSAIYMMRGAARRFVMKHRITAHLLVGLVSLLVAYWVLDAVERMTPLNRQTIRWLTAYVPPAGLGEQFSSVRIVALQPETDVKKLGLAHGAPMADPARPPTLRALHARLMRKLAESGARVVAFDIAFAKPVPQLDELFVQGVSALRERGIPVVVAAPDWQLNADGQPQLSPTIAAETSSGTTRMNFGAHSPWALQVVAGPHAALARPGFPLAVASAYWRPFARPGFALDAGLSVVQITYAPPVQPVPVQLPSIPAPRTSLASANPQYESVPVTRCTVFADEDFDRAGGLAPDDIVGQYFLQMWPQAALERSTTGYDQVLNAEPAMLRKMFADKVVVVGDFCTVGKDKLYQAPDGRELAGIYAQAMGIESLINGRTIRQPGMISLGGWRLYGQRPVDVAGAVAGVLLGAWLWRRAVRRGFVLCVLLLFAVGLSVLVYRWQRTIYLPFVPCLAMLLATELSAAIERARGGARRLSVNMSSVHRPQLA